MSSYTLLLYLMLLLFPRYFNVEKVNGTGGDDNLVVHAVLGEPTIYQDYEAAGTGATGENGETLRADDENDPVNPGTRTYFPKLPEFDVLHHMKGKGGADEYLIRTYISGKPAIVGRHVGDGGVIDWEGVAGENDNVHDHWVDFAGLIYINGFKRKQGDTIRVQGHTVSLKSITRFLNYSIITIESQQGDGGGAHDEDMLAHIIVRGDRVKESDIEFTRENDGIARTYTEFLALAALYEAAGSDDWGWVGPIQRD